METYHICCRHRAEPNVPTVGPSESGGTSLAVKPQSPETAGEATRLRFFCVTKMTLRLYSSSAVSLAAHFQTEKFPYSHWISRKVAQNRLNFSKKSGLIRCPNRGKIAGLPVTPRRAFLHKSLSDMEDQSDIWLSRHISSPFEKEGFRGRGSLAARGSHH